MRLLSSGEESSMRTLLTQAAHYGPAATPTVPAVLLHVSYARDSSVHTGMFAAVATALATSAYLGKERFRIRTDLPKYPQPGSEHCDSRPPIADELAGLTQQPDERLRFERLRFLLLVIAAAGAYWLLHDVVTTTPALWWSFVALPLLPLVVLIVQFVRLNRRLSRFDAEQAAVRLELMRPFLTQDLQDAANWSDSDWADIDWSSEDWAAYSGLPDAFKLQAMEVRVLALRTADRSLEALRTVDFFDGDGSQAELEMGCNRVYILSDLNDHERAVDEFERLRSRFGQTFDFKLYGALLGRQLQLEDAEELIEVTRADLVDRDWPAESRLTLRDPGQTPLECFEMSLAVAGKSPAEVLAEIREMLHELLTADANQST